VLKEKNAEKRKILVFKLYIFAGFAPELFGVSVLCVKLFLEPNN